LSKKDGRTRKKSGGGEYAREEVRSGGEKMTHLNVRKGGEERPKDKGEQENALKTESRN